MNRFRWVVLTMLIASVFGVVLVKAKTYILNKGASTNEAGAFQPAIPAAFAHVPPGIPIALSNLSIIHENDNDSDKRPYLGSLVFRIVALNGNSLTSLNFTVFEFDAKGSLRRVGQYASEQEGVRQGAVEITLPLARRFQADDRLVLAVGRVADGARTWEVDFNNLAKQAANIAKGRQPEPLAVKENAPVPADQGPGLCLNGIRRARALAQPASPAEVAAKITSFSCDQNRRSFTFTITGKNL